MVTRSWEKGYVVRGVVLAIFGQNTTVNAWKANWIKI